MNEWQLMVRRWKNQIQRWLAGQKAAREAKQSNKRPDYKMCPTCGKFNASNASVCEYCDSGLTAKPAGDFDAYGRPRSKSLNPVTIIFFICIGFHALAIFLSSKIDDYELAKQFWAPHGGVLAVLGANVRERTIFGGEFWRIATYMFLHGGFIHIFFNLSALAQLGPLVVQAFGNRRFWLIVMLTGIGGGLVSAASIFIFGRGNSVGFSGSLFGFIGAGYIWLRSNGNYYMAERFKKFMIWGNIIFIGLTITGIFPIDNFAHLGGMFTGMGVALFFQSRLGQSLKPSVESAVLGLLILFWAYGLYRSFLFVDLYFMNQ